MPIISIPSKKATGTLNRRAKSFAPGVGGGLALLNIAVNWQPNQTSGPVSFAFTLNESKGGFLAGTYLFTGNINNPLGLCGHDLIACGTVNWPAAPEGIDPTDPPPNWEATGGPEDEDDEDEDEDEDTEGPAGDTE
jgi:hypothetical protein